ncbi:hypothetical protein A4X06_0g8587 [Tilletia controversa]|uniref:Cation/H+ exchanger domain-containing protein n=1 Tax=Tilletia controversa TaxID=13291 RepID=A0A8X7MKK1_9BASI|nr:hypothetical protein A4X06_0g8587 [Tilletia controversa]
MRSTAVAASSSSTSPFSADAISSLTSIPYIAPPIQTLLTLTSFLLLSLFPRLFSHLLSASAPVLGPLLLGLIYGAPLSSILESDVQRAVSSIGYLGLILLLVQGGSETRLDVLSDWGNADLATVAGLTGISMPIFLSVLMFPSQGAVRVATAAREVPVWFCIAISFVVAIAMDTNESIAVAIAAGKGESYALPTGGHQIAVSADLGVV